MTLSTNFSLSEFTKSSTSKRLGLDNTPSLNVIKALTYLCLHVLQPLRNWYGKAIIISSGYRSPKVNKAVGGVSTSQHMKGEAADLHLPSLEIGRRWFNYIRDNLPFDQLIWEHDKSGTYWIHVSCKTDLSKNRHQVINNLLKQ